MHKMFSSGLFGARHSVRGNLKFSSFVAGSASDGKGLLQTNENRVYVLDGTAMLFKAYYSGIARTKYYDMKEPDLTESIMRHLKRFLDQVQPKYVAVAFDHGKQTFRNILYPEYKQKRPKAPIEVAGLYNTVGEIISSVGVSTYSVAGVEADDVMASIGTWVNTQHKDVVYVSEDKDMLQLISDRAFVMKSSKQIIWDADMVQRHFSIPAKHLIDFQALSGDAADCIPGIKGIGPKIATLLIRQFGTIEKMYSCANACAQLTENGVVVDINHPRFEEMRICVAGDAVVANDSSKAAKKINNKAIRMITLLLSGGEVNALLYKDLTTLRRDVLVPNLSMEALIVAPRIKTKQN